MDITFKTDNGNFNYRVCAIIVHDGKLLAMQDERSPYYYLPGGRVRMHETAETALLREVREELLVDVEIVRPLWMCQSFFTEDVNLRSYHELCLYFLTDISKTNLLSLGNKFVLKEGTHTHRFEWLPFNELREKYLYPLFIKEKIFHLPEQLTLITEIE